TNPGRVCTLIPAHEWNSMFAHDPTTPKISDETACWGMAYKVKSGMEQQVKAHLDYREKDGYTIDFVDVFDGSLEQPVLTDVMVYVGVSDNPSFAGASSLHDTAKVIAHAEGPSGTNREYLFHLCRALREKNPRAVDLYLESLEKLVNEIVA
ncbi:hypothetical protein LPJ56_002375, partial [Coemansia sp. RSA 2599]